MYCLPILGKYVDTIAFGYVTFLAQAKFGESRKCSFFIFKVSSLLAVMILKYKI
jgi:hypothetical protein